jgi:hypothetical protein
MKVWCRPGLFSSPPSASPTPFLQHYERDNFGDLNVGGKIILR